MAEILDQLKGNLSPCWQRFIHVRWCRISSINSSIVYHDGNQGDFKSDMEDSHLDDSYKLLEVWSGEIF